MSASWRSRRSNTSLSHTCTHTQTIHDDKATKIALGKLCSTKTCEAQKKGGHIEKHREHFTCVIPYSSPEQLNTKTDDIGEISNRRKRRTGGAQQSWTSVDICSLCREPAQFPPLLYSSVVLPAVFLCVLSPGLELSLWWDLPPEVVVTATHGHPVLGHHKTLPSTRLELPLCSTCPPPRPQFVLS